MILTNLKIALRNLTKRKGYTFLNIFGLTVGMTCCLLIFHYVSYEKSYDDFQPESKNIVRLSLNSYQQGKLAWKSATIYPAIGPTMKKDYPEVVAFTRLHDANLLLSNESNNTKFNETEGYYADAASIEMFDLNLTKGNPSGALDAPDKIILSETLAKKYFGKDEPLGKRLTVRNSSLTQSYEVTGVFEDYPSNSHLDIRYLVSYNTLQKMITVAWGDSSNATETSWGWYDFYTYLQLKPGTDPEKFEGKFDEFVKRNMDTLEFYKKNNYRHEIELMTLGAIHLGSNLNQEANVNGNGQAVKFLFLIAILIILIAWINYINMATARSIERAREVGVRKVMGALRGDLIRQFLTESFMLNIFALSLSLGLYYLLAPAFDNMVGRAGSISTSLDTNYWLIFLSLFFAGTFISGMYPAFVLSSFQPVKVLKGMFKNSSRGTSLRKGLIITQFIVTVVLIAGTLIVYQQMKYMQDQQLGFNIDETLVLKGAESLSDSTYQSSFQPFKNELLQNRSVKGVSSSSEIMGNEIYWTSSIGRPDKPDNPRVTLYHLGIDHDFIPSYGMKFAEGRNFQKENKADEKAVLLNQKAVELMGFTSNADAIDKYVLRSGDSLKIIGVVNNYHHQGLQKAINPMIFLLVPDTRSYYSVKLQTSDVSGSIAAIESVWKKHFPADPLEYFFLDETFNEQYKSERLFGKVFGTFAVLAILIACFGLLGLSAYNILQRTKEIGIRKVLGATGQNILFLLSKDFLKLIAIALVLAIPVGWWIMHSWLEDFAYRINIQWWVFGVAGLLALVIAFVTISLQVIKALVENPVKSLRSE